MSSAERYRIRVKVNTEYLDDASDNIVRLLRVHDVSILAVSVKSRWEMVVLIAAASEDDAQFRVSSAVEKAMSTAGWAIIPGVSFETFTWGADIVVDTVEQTAEDIGRYGDMGVFVLITGIVAYLIVRVSL